MSPTLEEQIELLKNTIAELQAQRRVLGDAMVDASIFVLKQHIAELQAHAEPQQQRKLVTILFMDVVGSTAAISTRLDPENTLEIMDHSLKRMASPIDEYGGHVTRFMGDGFMAIFGSPVARENDAEMAVRAGLGILSEAAIISAELQAQWQIPSFRVRVGINTGLVALGGITEAEDTIMGSTVNLAARLESAAPPGGLLISHATNQHVRNLFIMEPQEPIVVKGFDKPVSVYLVKDIRSHTFHLSTRGVEGVEIRMIGRQAELVTLQDALDNLLHKARGQALTIVGDAGVGKSRLLYEFQQHIEQHPEPVTLYQARARQESQHQPYGLLRDLFTQIFQIQEDDNLETVRNKIEEEFTRLVSLQKSHLIGHLLGFDFHNSPFILELNEDAQSLRDRALLALDEYFRLASQQSASILFLEDIHWADDSSLDCVTNLTRKAIQLPLLIISLARPVIFERRSDWREHRNIHFINLSSLTSQESHQLVNEILQKVAYIPDTLRELVVSNAEGNPFYIEELIKMLIEKGTILKGEQAWKVESTKLEGLEVPSTLTGVLQARLDSLAERERLLLQGASVIGRTFWDHALAYLFKDQEDRLVGEIGVGLGSLHQKELIFPHKESAFAGAVEYIFKHVILREVTYESVLKRKRRIYHARVAQWLIDHGLERASEHTGFIADHLERAGKSNEAIPYLIQAGERSARQYANREAVDYFSRALAQTPITDLEALYQLHLARERVLDIQGLRQLQAEDLATLKQIALALDDIHKQAHVALRQVLYFNHTGNFPASLEIMEKAIHLAQQAEDVRCEGALQMQWGIALWRQGKYATAQPTLEQALEIAQDAHLDTIAGDGIRTLGPAFAHMLADKHSSVRFEQALEKYRQAGDRRGEAYTLNNLGQFFAEFKGNLSKAQDHYEQALAIWREIGDRRNEGLTVFNLGMNAAKNNAYKQAIVWLSASLDIRCQVGDHWGERITLTSLGECHFHLGEYDQVLGHYQSALAIAQQIGDRRGELTLLGLLGNYFRDLGNFDNAQAYYDQVEKSIHELNQVQDKTQFHLNISMLLHQRGQDQVALEHCWKASEMIIGGDFPDLEWMGLTMQGHAQTALGKLPEGEIAYKKASAKASKWRRPLLDFESTAGFARVLLAQDKHQQALLGIEKLLAHIQKNPASGTHSPLDGTLEPLRMYLTCWQVLHANQDSRAPGVLRQAYDLVQTRAAVISDEKLRAFYLDGVLAHHQILKAYKS